MKTYAFRVNPGQDLREEIEKFVAEKDIKAGVIITCVGNLKKVVLRMADEKITKTWEGTFEIVSLVGTVEVGHSHLHLSISDVEGQVIGGHLKKDTIIGITAEIVIGELENIAFSREFDEETGFKELIIKENYKRQKS